MSAKDVLARLRDGNQRFVTGSQEQGAPGDKAAHRRGSIPVAMPIAIILGCSDSRVPVETIFDQGIGDLFVVRVAGNIAGPSQIGSIEFAVEQFATSLVVVLGHSMCGAVMAAIEDLRSPAATRSPNFRQIVDVIRPAVTASAGTEGVDDPGGLLARSVRANVGASINGLLEGSRLLAQRVQENELLVVGAEYALNTGIVKFMMQRLPDTSEPSASRDCSG